MSKNIYGHGTHAFDADYTKEERIITNLTKKERKTNQKIPNKVIRLHTKRVQCSKADPVLLGEGLDDGDGDKGVHKQAMPKRWLLYNRRWSLRSCSSSSWLDQLLFQNDVGLTYILSLI